MAIGWGVDEWSGGKASYGVDTPGISGGREKDFLLHVVSMEDLQFVS